MSDDRARTETETWHDGQTSRRDDVVVRESAVALVYNGVSHVVMMLTPSDLEDFALGFSLTEGILSSPAQLLALETVSLDEGIEVQLTITAERFAALKERRRNLAGRTGCGLCGAESLVQAMRTAPTVPAPREVSAEAVQRALAQLDTWQPLQAETGAVHGAAWCDPQGNIVLSREDVGRHNALDKMLGAHVRQGFGPEGFVLITSRASYEMVSKVANRQLSTLVAVSAATSLAIEQARSAGMQLIGFARPGRQVRYC